MLRTWVPGSGRPSRPPLAELHGTDAGSRQATADPAIGRTGWDQLGADEESIVANAVSARFGPTTASHSSARSANIPTGAFREHIGELAIERSGSERLEITVELATDPADRALGEPAPGVERLHQVIDASPRVRDP